MRDVVPFFTDRLAISRSIADQMDKLVNEMFGKDFFPGALAKGSYPKMNVYESEGSLRIDAYVPDLPKDKVHVEIKDHILTIRGDSNQDKELSNEQYYCREVSKRAFTRSVRLPDSLDEANIKGKLADGMLRLSISYLDKTQDTNFKKVEIE